MFQYLKTCFNLIAGLIDEDVLIIVALVVALLLALWIVLSLVTCKELKIAKNSKKLAKLIDENGLTEDTEPEVIAIVSKMPKQIGTAFRLYTSGRGRAPGEVLTQTTCVEVPLYGGLYKQNRSLMRSAINMVFCALLLFSLMITAGTEAALTGAMIAESLIVPLVALLLFRGEYYVYTTIRQYYYKLAVDNFTEFVDVLNEKYENDEITLPCGERFDFLTEDDLDMEEKRGRGRPKKTEEEKLNDGEINNDADFARALNRAEVLMQRLHKDLSDSQKRRTNHELAELMGKLSEYKKRKK